MPTKQRLAAMKLDLRIVENFRIIKNVSWLLVLTGVFYSVSYFAMPATPGNAPSVHPMGWWGWFDQSQYLASAEAMTRGDFTPGHHYYPPLYPALGALFLPWSSGHPYFLINAACLLWMCFVFLRFSARYFARWVSVVILASSVFASPRLFENFLVPWSSTLSGALLATGILGLIGLGELRDGSRSSMAPSHAFWVGLSLGLVVPTRPADAVIGGIIGGGLLVGYLEALSRSPASLPPPGRVIGLFFLGGAIGPLSLLAFNQAVFDSPVGGYLQVAAANGFHAADLPEKLFSLWLDGQALYAEANSGLIDHYPWLLVSIAGILWVLWRGDILLRTAALAVGGLFLLYSPYGDLLPTGMWRFLNIHYFKWTFPYLAMFAWFLVRDILRAPVVGGSRTVPAALMVFTIGLLCTIELVTYVEPVKFTFQAGQRRIVIDLPEGDVDLVDIKGISGGFTDIYFGTHQVRVDGQELQRIRDFRLLPRGSEVRVLFIRPIHGRTLEFEPDSRLAFHGNGLAGHVGTYKFSLGLPRPFRRSGPPGIIAHYQLGDLVDFSQGGTGWLYALDGWSIPETWGRWSVDREARLQLHLSPHSEKTLFLEVSMGALVGRDHPCQRVVVSLNDQSLGEKTLCIDSGGNLPSTFNFPIPQASVPASGLVDVRISTPDAISPSRLGIGSDGRILGVGVKDFRISASPGVVAPVQ